MSEVIETEEKTDAQSTIDILARSVQIATGIPDAGPRDGQAAFTKTVANVMTLGGQGETVGILPTGSGKSFAALSAAANRAVRHGERTVVSTESLALQAQYVEKDAPVVQAAVHDLYGYDLSVAVLKGFSNYLCAQRVSASARAALGLSDAPLTNKQLRDAADALKKGAGDPTPLVEEFGVEADLIIPLIHWALEQHVGPGAQEVGDKFSYEGKITHKEWGAVSISSSECLRKKCPLIESCKVIRSREVASEADVVITNHSILAVQAANSLPLIIGSKNLTRESDGEGFKHVIVDEAHTLPGEVRSQGSNEMSGGKVLSCIRSVSRVVDGTERWADNGEKLAELIEQQLARLGGNQPERKLEEADDPMLQPIADATKAWAKEGANMLKFALESPSAETTLRAYRAQNNLERLTTSAETVASKKSGVARWIALPDHKRNRWHVAHAAPVDVSNLIKNSLWNIPQKPDEHGEEPDPVPVTAVVMSATLPTRFGNQVGIPTPEVDYPSPFDTAYGASMLYIPRADSPEDVAALSDFNRWRNKNTFSTQKHADWAADHIVRLVSANKGAALVIGAKADSAKKYAEALRARTNVRVLSQWDGEGLRQLVDEWRDDENAVLVGTRSLMTGVDAPGHTCSLVILDRPPRAAGNPVDDARVESLAARLGDKWAADRMVYVADAGALTEQAGGRLVRSTSDFGMFALLDPRMLKVGPFQYPEPTRALYKKAVRRFMRLTANQDEALTFLEEQAARREA